MAEPSRTVRVSGVPADIEEGRLKDKLLIHFLRARNGGGEIDSLTIVKGTPLSALIVFEECEAATTAIERSPHVLEVSGKKYKLSVTKYREVLDPDEIVTRLSAVMDYSRVPGGALALRHLQEKHPDIHLSYDDTLELHTVYGAYSKVQAALTQLFGQPGNQQPDTVQQAPSGSWSEHSSQKQQTTPSEGGKPSKQGGQSKTVDTLRIPECSSSSQRDQLTSLAYGGEDIGQREGATPQLNWPSEDESLLIVDADMFQYLQKYCQKDYQQILSVYGVEVVEMTNQGFTSLYLQPAAGAEESVRDRGSLSLARNAMSQFFLENEAKIWRADFSKSIFASGKDLQMAKDNLSLRHPTILLKEDDTNIYMIGNYKDMWDAKQFFLDQSLHQYLKSEEDEMARRCRLAPRFKESGLPPLGSRPTDFCLRGATTAQSRPKSSGPMLGFNVLSEPGQTGERVPRVPPQIAAEDFLFKSQRSLSPTLSMQNDTSLNSDLIKSQPKTASLDRSLGPPAVSGSTLKRANSFSGTPQRKPQVTQQGSQDDTTKSTAGARSSSSGLTDHLSRDRQAGYTADIVLSSVMWQHIKEAHGTQVGDLTSDIQTRESVHADGGSVTVYLRGASSSKLKSCRLGLQKLIDSVSADFFVHKLPLSELGLTDPTDETLLACCNNMRSCFHTVTIQITEENVSLLGPKLRCSQAAASLLGVFSRDLAHSYTHQEFPDPSTSKYDPETLTQSSKDQSSTLRSHSKSQPMPETSTGSTDGTSIDRERRTNHAGFAETENVNGSVSQPRPYKDPVIKEKVKYAESGDSAQKERAQQRHKERESRSSAEAERLGWGIHGRMTFSKLSISIPGHQNDAAIKITYYIPDGIQKEGHPAPGKPFQGGVFDAYLPDNETAMRLLPRLEEAFKQGLTFTVVGKEAGAKVTWNYIPHKTSLHGGKSGCGYPDSTYLTRLAGVLTTHGIEEPPAKFK